MTSEELKREKLEREKLKRLADISTITSAIITAIGVIAAAVTVVVSSCQFQKGQESEHESKAVELFIKYEKLMTERGQLYETGGC